MKLGALDPSYDGRRIFFDAKGYAIVWVEGKNKKVHVLEWVKHNGPKPDGYEIHHKDENKANWSIDNLELLTNRDHQRIHAGWVKEDGEWAKKPCTSCLSVLPLGAFYERKGYTPSARCKSCHCKATQAWANDNREARRAIGRSYYHRSKQHA